MYKLLILASASPRRRELLTQIGADFIVFPARGEEVITKKEPREVVCELALSKACEVADAIARGEGPKAVEESIAGRLKGARDQIAAGEYLVLGADTVVVYEGRILGKPVDETDAVRMLTSLEGKTHHVYTGVALIDVEGEKREICQFFQETQVEMYPLSPQEILDYVASGEPMDKAGAYGIQGRGTVLIKEIRGDYNNVVGLPVAEICQRLKQLGIEISAKA